MDQKLIILIVIAAVVILGLGYFVFFQQQQVPQPPGIKLKPGEVPAAPTPESAPPSEGLQPRPPRQVTVTGTEFKFEPSEIKVKPGERLRINFVNAGLAPHNWTIEGLGVATNTIGPGQQTIIEFTVPAEGEFPLTVFCSVPGHRESGMVGTLVVE